MSVHNKSVTGSGRRRLPGCREVTGLAPVAGVPPPPPASP
jgi:hypothetical protein